MLYAFNIGEARVAFHKALKIDPSALLAYWGLGEAEVIDINQLDTAEGERRGSLAARQALEHLTGADPEESALVRSIAVRFGSGPLRRRLARFADTLADWTREHRSDPNALVIAAVARMRQNVPLVNSGSLTPAGQEVLDDLNSALAEDPGNLGAHHMRIHFWEYIGAASFAQSDAEALSACSCQLGESHLLHMASHVWDRMGEYDRMASDGARAAANDRAYFAGGSGAGQEYMRRYHDHDVNFILYALTTTGRYAEAARAAAKESGVLSAILDIRSHDYRRAIAFTPTSDHFLLSFAEANLGMIRESQLEQASLAKSFAGQRKAADIRLAAGNGDVYSMSARRALLVRNAAIEGDLIEAARDRRAGKLAQAAERYRAAYEQMTKSYPGDPKDFWYAPVGEGYGALLLASHRPAAAEAVFEAQLDIFPHDPRLAWGLAEALSQQHKDSSVARSDYKEHWHGRELKLSDLG